MGCVTAATAQVPLSVARTFVKVTLSPDSGRVKWQVSRGWLDSDFQSTWAYVRITNTSDTAYTAARFYGEYYDSADRVCFQVAFAQDSNQEQVRGPFLPGETRTLRVDSSLAPATLVAALRLHYLGDDEQVPSIFELAAPVTIKDSTREPIEEFVVTKQPDNRVTPFALVEATIDVQGVANSARTLDAMDDQAKRWATKLVPTLRFNPATSNGQSVTERTLILIQLLRPSEKAGALPEVPVADNPWIKAYIATHAGTPSIPVVQLLRLQDLTDDKHYKYFSIGTDWCLTVFRWLSDPQHGGRRQWLPAVTPH
jgi:hypothetical protein